MNALLNIWDQNSITDGLNANDYVWNMLKTKIKMLKKGAFFTKSYKMLKVRSVGWSKAHESISLSLSIFCIHHFFSQNIYKEKWKKDYVIGLSLTDAPKSYTVLESKKEQK